MTKKLMFYLLLLFTVVSCDKVETDNHKAQILGEGTPLKLEALDFNENVIELYSKVSIIDSLKSKFAKHEATQDFSLLEELDFKVFEVESLNISIPKYEYGYLFKGKIKDSLAHFHKLYFNELESLTNVDRKLVAVNASSEYRNRAQRDSLVMSINKIYGKPILEVFLSNEFNRASYSWVTKNKIIEISTSYGFSMEVNTSGKSENYKYYKLDLLMIDIGELEGIVQAHRYYYNDNFEPTYEPNLAGSNFLPNFIGIKDYFLDNTGQYGIENAEE